MKTLPRKLSVLHALSLRDLRKAERSKKFKIYMGAWLRSGNRKCVACQAGAVMAFSLKADLDYCYDPYGFPGNEDQLFAINNLRNGYVKDAAFTLALSKRALAKAAKLDRGVADYHDDKTQFWKDQRKLLRDLREAGL